MCLELLSHADPIHCSGMLSWLPSLFRCGTKFGMGKLRGMLAKGRYRWKNVCCPSQRQDFTFTRTIFSRHPLLLFSEIKKNTKKLQIYFRSYLWLGYWFLILRWAVHCFGIVFSYFYESRILCERNYPSMGLNVNSVCVLLDCVLKLVCICTQWYRICSWMP